MAGRHGNKGVISKILPMEDMPHLEDGTPVDIVLNPLGVPSPHERRPDPRDPPGVGCAGLGRQIGELMESGRTAAAADAQAARAASTTAKASARSCADCRRASCVELGENLREWRADRHAGVRRRPRGRHRRLLEEAGLHRSGQVTLFDGRTGEPFDRQVTVGYIYMLKLHHLVDDKIHARSIGPYSLVTQQPLGGKAQFGGQRFGEMEVLGAGGLRRGLHPAGDADGEVGRRGRAAPRSTRRSCSGEDTFEAGMPESLQRAGQGAAVAGPERGAARQLSVGRRAESFEATAGAQAAGHPPSALRRESTRKRS